MYTVLLLLLVVVGGLVVTSQAASVNYTDCGLIFEHILLATSCRAIVQTRLVRNWSMSMLNRARARQGAVNLNTAHGR
jgi:hypothetical protein